MVFFLREFAILQRLCVRLLPSVDFFSDFLRLHLNLGHSNSAQKVIRPRKWNAPTNHFRRKHRIVGWDYWRNREFLLEARLQRTHLKYLLLKIWARLSRVSIPKLVFTTIDLISERISFLDRGARSETNSKRTGAFKSRLTLIVRIPQYAKERGLSQQTANESSRFKSSLHFAAKRILLVVLRLY